MNAQGIDCRAKILQINLNKWHKTLPHLEAMWFPITLLLFSLLKVSCKTKFMLSVSTSMNAFLNMPEENSPCTRCTTHTQHTRICMHTDINKEQNRNRSCSSYLKKPKWNSKLLSNFNIYQFLSYLIFYKKKKFNWTIVLYSSHLRKKCNTHKLEHLNKFHNNFSNACTHNSFKFLNVQLMKEKIFTQKSFSKQNVNGK